MLKLLSLCFNITKLFLFSLLMYRTILSCLSILFFQKLVREYYDKLISLRPALLTDPSPYTFDQCYSEYIIGGIGRWMWFLAMMSTTMPLEIMRYFNTQVRAFANDHGITPDNVPQPRI